MSDDRKGKGAQSAKGTPAYASFGRNATNLCTTGFISEGKRRCITLKKVGHVGHVPRGVHAASVVESRAATSSDSSSSSESPTGPPSGSRQHRNKDDSSSKPKNKKPALPRSEVRMVMNPQDGTHYWHWTIETALSSAGTGAAESNPGASKDTTLEIPQTSLKTDITSQRKGEFSWTLAHKTTIATWRGFDQDILRSSLKHSVTSEAPGHVVGVNVDWEHSTSPNADVKRVLKLSAKAQAAARTLGQVPLRIRAADVGQSMQWNEKSDRMSFSASLQDDVSNSTVSWSVDGKSGASLSGNFAFGSEQLAVGVDAAARATLAGENPLTRVGVRLMTTMDKKTELSAGWNWERVAPTDRKPEAGEKQYLTMTASYPLSDKVTLGSVLKAGIVSSPSTMALAASWDRSSQEKFKVKLDERGCVSILAKLTRRNQLVTMGATVALPNASQADVPTLKFALNYDLSL